MSAIDGDLIAGIGGLRAGQANAAMAKAQAVASLQDGAAKEAKVRSDARAAAGEAIAAQGASGLQLGTGSALELLRDNATNASLDALSIRANAANGRSTALAAAKQAKQAGYFALAGGIAKAAGDAAQAAAGAGG